jgi:hypothetical protein
MSLAAIKVLKVSEKSLFNFLLNEFVLIIF